ncbi:triose-phosphate isomerase [symbiont of Argiope bruennichi]|uniref:triose-phosphate isomerase n=1 Tax=symbiont of Argiope bruennichi TaxID=2810479 RepID=UPI003DA1F030
MKNKYLIANWKMNLLSKDITDFSEYFKNFHSKINLGICCNFLYLEQVKKLFPKSWNIYAQNYSEFLDGAYTGETSCLMLKDKKISHALIGHSERRNLFLENNSKVNTKILLGLKYDFKLIFCIGETLEQRQNNETYQVLENQIKLGLLSVKNNEISNIIIAYEPVWAINTGISATDEEIFLAVDFIKKTIKNIYPETKEAIPVLYGGSVNDKNIDVLKKIAVVDGFLVGSSSLKKEAFLNLIKKYEK